MGNGIESRNDRLILISIFFATLLLDFGLFFFFFFHYASHFPALTFTRLVTCIGIAILLFNMRISLKIFHKPDTPSGALVDLSSVFVISILPILGPATALASYGLAFALFESNRKLEGGRKLPLRPKLINSAFNTASYGVAFLSALQIASLDLNHPFILLGQLFMVLLIQTIIVVLLYSYYFSLVANEKFLNQLRVRIQPHNIFVEALLILLFPGVAWLAIRMWVYGYPWAISFLIVLFIVIYLSMRAFGRILDNLFALLVAMMKIVEVRDPYTEWHCGNVAEYTGLIAKYLGLGEDGIDAAKKKARVHDFGKILVPDSVLLNPGKLTNEEFEIMKKHTYLKDVLIKFLPHGFEITEWLNEAIHHHERFDGTGYPDGLIGQVIPLHARIMALADAWDAMTTSRVYRKTPLTREQALEEVKKYRGKQWDPSVVDAFLKAVDDGEVYALMDKLHGSRRHQDEAFHDKTAFDSSPPASLVERNRSGGETKPLKVENESDAPTEMSFSYAKIVKDGFKIIWPFLIGFFVYLFPEVPVNLKDFIFFVGLLFTVERWEFKNPLGFNISYGEIVYIFSLYVFPLQDTLGLIGFGFLWRVVARRYGIKFELIQLCKRLTVYSLSSSVFGWLNLRDNQTTLDWTKISLASFSASSRSALFAALRPLQHFLCWMVAFGAVQFLFLSLKPGAGRASNAPLIRQFRLWHFLFFYVFIFPVLSYASYFLYAAKPMLFPYSYLIFLPVIFTTFVLFKMYSENLNACRWTAQAISRAVDSKFTFTEGNSESIASLSGKIAIEMDMHEDEVEWVVSAAFVHNIGRVGIHDKVLMATSNLSADDLKEVRSLCGLSVKILKELPFYKDPLDIIEGPRERYDGKGYPNGLNKKKIPLGARIVAAVDAVIAMVSLRPDRNPLTLEQAIEELKAKSGTQFAPEVVKAVVRLHKKGVIQVKVARKRLDDAPSS